MSLQFILGGSGTGKSACLYDMVINRSMAEPDADIILLVPEQYTMLTQRHLVRQHPRHSVLNVDVLSFERLAYRIFEETGTDCQEILDDTGKSMILRRILARHGGELHAFGGNVRKRGFTDQVKSMLSELLQYGVDPALLQEKGSALAPESRLFAKIRDISLIYTLFLDFIGDRYMTTEQVLDRLCAVIGKSDRMRRAVIYMDNFTGFTPVQLKVMEKILQICPQVVMTLCADTEDLSFSPDQPDKDELFYITKETIWRMDEICRQYRIPREKDILLGQDGQARFADRPDLSALERNLFRTRMTSHQKPAESISLTVAANPDGEMRAAAAQIHQLVTREGLRYSDIAVIASDMETYRSSAQYWFSVYQIPCFFDARRPVSSGMAAEWLRSLLDMISRGFGRDQVFRFLRSGLAGLEREETDLLENYVLAAGIRGWSRWNKVWTARKNGIGEEELVKINQIREKFVAPLADLAACAKKSQLRFGDLVKAVYQYMEDTGTEEKILAWQEHFAAAGDLSREKEYDQIYDTLIDLLERIYYILGEEEGTVREFSDICEAGLRQVKLGIIPPALDQVTFGDTLRTRLDEVKVLIFAGLNDSLVPRVESSAGMITDRDREELADMGLVLAPTVREQMCTQRYYLYAVMTKPSMQLILSRSLRNAAGDTQLPASLLKDLKKIFPGLPETYLLTDEHFMRYGDVHQASRFLTQGYRKEAAGDDPGPLWYAVREWFARSPEGKRRLEELERAAYFRYTGEILSDAAVQAVYEGRLSGGVTMLEKYAQCAYSHFLTYGLRLQEREVYEVSTMDIGNIFHKAIELFSRRVTAGGSSWRTIGDEARDRLAEQCVQEAVSDYRGDLMQGSSRAQYITEKITKMAKRTLWILQEQIRKGDFEPAGYEVDFTDRMENAEMNLQTEGGRVSLRGKVDRLDILEEDGKKYLRIIDYKTGTKEFKLDSVVNGVQLQLVVYMNAVCSEEGKKDSKVSVIPAGIFYYNIKDPFLDTDSFAQIGAAEEEMSDQEGQNQFLDQFPMKGLAIGDEDLLLRMDHDPRKAPNVMGLKVSSKNEIKAEDHLAAADDYDLLSRFVREKTMEIGNAVFSGQIKAAPYRDGSRTACDYCPYRSVCGFDIEIGGYEYRRGKTFKKKEEIWQYLAERRRQDGSDMDESAEGSH